LPQLVGVLLLAISLYRSLGWVLFICDRESVQNRGYSLFFFTSFFPGYLHQSRCTTRGGGFVAEITLVDRFLMFQMWSFCTFCGRTFGLVAIFLLSSSFLPWLQGVGVYSINIHRFLASILTFFTTVHKLSLEHNSCYRFCLRY
jgi:hypothetical protein